MGLVFFIINLNIALSYFHQTYKDNVEVPSFRNR